MLAPCSMSWPFPEPHLLHIPVFQLSALVTLGFECTGRADRRYETQTFLTVAGTETKLTSFQEGFCHHLYAIAICFDLPLNWTSSCYRISPCPSGCKPLRDQKSWARFPQENQGEKAAVLDYLKKPSKACLGFLQLISPCFALFVHQLYLSPNI